MLPLRLLMLMLKQKVNVHEVMFVTIQVIYVLALLALVMYITCTINCTHYCIAKPYFINVDANCVYAPISCFLAL